MQPKFNNNYTDSLINHNSINNLTFITFWKVESFVEVDMFLRNTYFTSSFFVLQGEYFNDEEVRLMLAAEALEERKKREEELIKEEEMAKEANQEEGKRKKRGIVIAT